MRTISRILALAHAATRTLAKWYAGELAVPILFALALSSGLFLAKALTLGSPSWALLGFLLGAVTYAAAEVGRRSFADEARAEAKREVSADIVMTRAISAARQASTASLRQAKRDTETPRTAIERHEAARSSLWAMRYEVATRPKGRDQ